MLEQQIGLVRACDDGVEQGVGGGNVGTRGRCRRFGRCGGWRLAKLQEDALFNGKYDGGDAVLTINAGTGGTDAQDWAEMMLRMYQRWAADRGFEMELIDPVLERSIRHVYDIAPLPVVA